MPNQTLEEELREEMPELYTGMKIEILTRQNRLVFIGIVEVTEGKEILIRDESGANVPWVEHNSKVKLKGFGKSGDSFTMYAYISGSSGSDSSWKINRLEPIQFMEMRRFFRQSVRLTGFLMYVNDTARGASVKGTGIFVPCVVQDLSANGARLHCDETAIFRVGEHLLLTMDDPMEKNSEMSFLCCVRRVEKGENSCEYGCEFEGLSAGEQEQLLRTVMRIQQRELRARRGMD